MMAPTRMVTTVLCLTLLSSYTLQAEAFALLKPLHSVQKASISQQHRIHAPTTSVKYVVLHSSKEQSTSPIDSDSKNAFTSIIANINNIFSNNKTKVETEEQRLARLKLERLQQLELYEQDRAEQVSNDKYIYLFLASLQLLPLIGSDRLLSVFYFWGVAVSTVYVGGKQITLEEERVSSENALYAPIGASISIGFLYLLIKSGLDPTALYAVAVSLFGALAISDVSVPVLRNLLPESFAKSTVPVPKKWAQSLDGGMVNELPLDGVVTLGLGLLCTAFYWAPVVMEQKFLVSNCKFLFEICPPFHGFSIMDSSLFQCVISHRMGTCYGIPWIYIVGKLSNGHNSPCWSFLL